MISFLKRFFWYSIQSSHYYYNMEGEAWETRIVPFFCLGYVGVIPPHFNAIHTPSCIRTALPVFLLRSPAPHPQTLALELFHYAKDRPQRLIVPIQMSLLVS